jgi:hypothetical protein
MKNDPLPTFINSSHVHKYSSDYNGERYQKTLVAECTMQVK